VDLARDRATLILNLCSLCVASVLAGESAYIASHAPVVSASLASWVSFVPAVSLFLMRRKVFSGIFLLLYLVVLAEVSHEFWMTLGGPPYPYLGKGVGVPQGALAVLSVLGLLLSVMGVTLGGLVRRIRA
jgi:hypothetical protein